MLEPDWLLCGDASVSLRTGFFKISEVFKLQMPQDI